MLAVAAAIAVIGGTGWPLEVLVLLVGTSLGIAKGGR